MNKLASAHENRLMLPGAKVHVVVSEDGEEFTFAKVEPQTSSAENAEVTTESDQSETDKSNKQIDWKLKLLIENPPDKSVGGSGGGFLNKIGLA